MIAHELERELNLRPFAPEAKLHLAAIVRFSLQMVINEARPEISSTPDAPLGQLLGVVPREPGRGWTECKPPLVG